LVKQSVLGTFFVLFLLSTGVAVASAETAPTYDVNSQVGFTGTYPTKPENKPTAPAAKLPAEEIKQILPNTSLTTGPTGSSTVYTLPDTGDTSNIIYITLASALAVLIGFLTLKVRSSKRRPL